MATGNQPGHPSHRDITPTLLNEFVASYSANHITMQNVGAWQRPAGYNLGLFQNGFGGGKLAWHLV